MNRDEIRACLTGPIPSIRMPFHEDGSMDTDSLRHQIDFIIAAGSKTILLTAGDSHYMCLSDDEIAEATRVTCQHTAGRVMVVAADRLFGTSRAIEFARFARNIGADVVMAQPPNWGPSCTPQTLADHYRAVSEHLPVMIVTNVFSTQGADFGLETVRLTLDQCPDVVAIKDDICGDFARRLCLLAHERCAVFAGGQKVNHMDMWPYGCDGYLSTFMSFRPDIARQYWSAIEARDLEAARAIIRDYDMPFFDFISKFTGGWNAGLHGTLEVFGIAKRWRRKPYYSLDDAEMEKLRAFLRVKGILA